MWGRSCVAATSRLLLCGLQCACANAEMRTRGKDLPCTRLCVHMCKCVHIFSHAHLPLHIYTCTFAPTHLHMNICSYTFSHSHAHAGGLLSQKQLLRAPPKKGAPSNIGLLAAIGGK
ncbi:hypothetical protein PVIIG_05491 [Plasmodium vivax India VII]|uniref:Secreted protein n=5 Tax=Plasmodium vivax TaxID=5855 RepID=A5K203_PLAVS|nr:hypothetical protein PVX_113960 [Plasmodium vivax]KMZ79531.1 hypothetical protein PVIIG_05491 [Plasmodium vivax India VII]KMZ85684.1 hypothetical protein PVBG_01194 [Plasmodium vivax Brazil I]KMZ92158.1 hypothetical protein PVMG_02146 [Plasmodium vivax Mauritania I]KMZ98669.1 hypothetical protein PVNG_03732 [Plasmodium vivax North Korean]EDL46453.1 hypothetical protein PVX_113960 [Plasmodium vivax]|eukprot:XP_001616180.1 hypothetical protein [Plasmodium vivax Sal-1]